MIRELVWELSRCSSMGWDGFCWEGNGMAGMGTGVGRQNRRCSSTLVERAAPARPRGELSF